MSYVIITPDRQKEFATKEEAAAEVVRYLEAHPTEAPADRTSVIRIFASRPAPTAPAPPTKR